MVEFVTLRTSWQQPAADRLSLRGPKVNSHIRLCRIDDSSVILVSLYLLLLLEFISHEKYRTVKNNLNESA